MENKTEYSIESISGSELIDIRNNIIKFLEKLEKNLNINKDMLTLGYLVVKWMKK